MCAAFNDGPHRVLIIDDDIDLLMLLERRLLREGYAVETAASLPEGEEIITHFEPHLVLLDVNVNGEDGRKLCWKLKRGDHPQDVKVIMISGYDCNTSRAVLFGADDMLAKPLHTEFLLNRLAQPIPTLLSPSRPEQACVALDQSNDTFPVLIGCNGLAQKPLPVNSGSWVENVGQNFDLKTPDGTCFPVPQGYYLSI